MKSHVRRIVPVALSQGGYSLVEMIVIMAIFGVLVAMTVPTFSDLRQRLQYRQAAQATVAALRLAKSRAVMTNRQHQVQFNSANRTFEVRQGNLATASTAFTTVVRSAESYPAGVFMNLSTAATITFNPTGSATQGTVRISTAADAVQHRVMVGTSGRIRQVKY